MVEAVINERVIEVGERTVTVIRRAKTHHPVINQESRPNVKSAPKNIMEELIRKMDEFGKLDEFIKNNDFHSARKLAREWIRDGRIIKSGKLMRLFDMAEAISLARKMVQKNNNDFFAINILVELLIHQKCFIEAEQTLIASLKIKDNDYGHYLMAHLNYYLGKLEAALCHIESAMVKGQSSRFVAMKLEILRKMKKYQAVIDIALTQPNNPGVMLCSAYSNLELERFIPAWQNMCLAESLIAKNPHSILWLRLYNGYIFLWKKMQRGMIRLPTNLPEKVTRAKRFLENCDERTLRHAQVKDFENALELIIDLE